ncbi:MAG TPA: EamA family transporter RarD [Kofleriaceae bacterium]|nr:EamA family transporter RarD [Kofleriaceae bacterium]
MNEARRGILHGALAYGLWGAVPAFWKLLGELPALELLGHRVVWGLLTLLALTAATGKLAATWRALHDRRVLLTMAASSILLSINWGTFVYAVSESRLLEASLGYFINPLVSVALGVIVLGERLRRAQKIAIAFAALGVTVLAIQRGQPPVLALVLAGTFGVYGLVRKTAKIESLAGTTVETGLMLPPALLLLGWLFAHDQGALTHASLAIHLLLVATGVVTAVPLLLFTSAARRLPLSTVGFLQYLAPTGQFLLAVLVYGEPFSTATLGAFAIIWTGLAVFSYDAWTRSASSTR